MARVHSLACTLSVMPGNSRRNSMAADISPCRSRIAAASASLTTNMLKAWRAHAAGGKQDQRTPRPDGDPAPLPSPGRIAG